jgi:hypothetical protein
MVHQTDAVDTDLVGEGRHLDRGSVEVGGRRGPVGRAHVEGHGGLDVPHDNHLPRGPDVTLA